MNWINNYVRPTFRRITGQKETPDNLWTRCGSCNQMVYVEALRENLHVCPHCDAHMRMNVKARLDSLFDGGSYETIELPKVAEDPLNFKDRKSYPARLKEYRQKTDRDDVFVVAHGKCNGHRLVIAAMDFSFMGGSLGMAAGDALLSAAKLAVLQKSSLLVVSSSGGARMQEGILSLIQLPRSVIAVNMVKEAGLPYIVLLADPTTGGVSASFAMLGDIHVSEPGATIGFAGARVIKQTIREDLPEGFQTAEYLRDNGMVDMVVPRTELRDRIADLLTLLKKQPKREEIASEEADESEAAEAEEVKEETPKQEASTAAKEVSEPQEDSAKADDGTASDAVPNPA